MNFLVTKDNESRRRVSDFIMALPDHLRWRVIVEENKPKRSPEQNNRYWAILSDIAQQVSDENGKKYSAEVWHEFFKAMFLGKETVLIDGQPHLVQKSTTVLKIMEFSDYCMKVEVWGAEHGVTFFNDAA